MAWKVMALLYIVIPIGTAIILVHIIDQIFENLKAEIRQIFKNKEETTP